MDPVMESILQGFREARAEHEQAFSDLLGTMTAPQRRLLSVLKARELHFEQQMILLLRVLKARQIQLMIQELQEEIAAMNNALGV